MNEAVDVRAGDTTLSPVLDSLEKDIAFMSYIETSLDAVKESMRSASIAESINKMDNLHKFVTGKKNALRGELARLRTPDS